MADHATKVVTLTATEKACNLEPISEQLDAEHPGIISDLATPMALRTALGLLVTTLPAVRLVGHAPPVLISCDNLAANGLIPRRAAPDFAALVNDGLST